MLSVALRQRASAACSGCERCLLVCALQEMNEKKQQELGRTSLKKYNKNPRMEIQKIENLNKPLALINQFCKDVGIKISIAAEGAPARRAANCAWDAS